VSHGPIVSSDRPLVSVVTPFFNTAPYLAECIESVLAQTYPNIEYILLDNCSTDGSTELAESYARQDCRIRLIRATEFFPQLDNYNRALKYISDKSIYCKVVQADDWILPECLGKMVQSFAQSESIGLVSSYWLSGNDLGGAGLPYETQWLSGRKMAQWFLQTRLSIFGTQTQVMYRSAVVRRDVPFYNVSFLFADLQKCMEILEHWDFGFVHQVLSFSRRDNPSILRHIETLQPYDALHYSIAKRYAPVFLEPEEATSIIWQSKARYYPVLARAALHFRDRSFWHFHKAIVEALNERETYDWPYLAATMARELFWLVSNPGTTSARAFRALKLKNNRKTYTIRKDTGILLSPAEIRNTNTSNTRELS
jgi:glycosyltransferase involved in cell wall biosynthesis